MASTVGPAVDGAPREFVSAVVPTKGRGDLVRPTIRSILDAGDDRMELIVVDQNEDDVTRQVIAEFDDDRIVHVRQDGSGAGRARNGGVECARGELVAFADDDVVVPPDWFELVRDEMTRHHDAAVVFTNVVPGEHDQHAGFVPASVRRDTIRVTSLRGQLQTCGIGAGMLARASRLTEMGGFDDVLGPGARFPSAEDGDISLRATLAGLVVVETNRIEVVHHGFRTWEQGRELTRRDWIALGAVYSKLMRAAPISGLPLLINTGLFLALGRPLIDLVRTRRLRGLRQAPNFWLGFVRGLRTPIDRSTMRFRV